MIGCVAFEMANACDVSIVRPIEAAAERTHILEESIQFPTSIPHGNRGSLTRCTQRRGQRNLRRPQLQLRCAHRSIRGAQCAEALLSGGQRQLLSLRGVGRYRQRCAACGASDELRSGHADDGRLRLDLDRCNGDGIDDLRQLQNGERTDVGISMDGCCTMMEQRPKAK